MRDEIVAKYHGDDLNYFCLKDSERSRLRKIAVQRYIEGNPAWLLRWENSLMDLIEEQRNMARPFACDLIASRMTIIWQGAKAHAKRKFLQETGEREKKRGRNEDMARICEKCRSEMQMKWICPCCDIEQSKEQSAVFL